MREYCSLQLRRDDVSLEITGKIDEKVPGNSNKLRFPLMSNGLLTDCRNKSIQFVLTNEAHCFNGIIFSEIFLLFSIFSSIVRFFAISLGFS